MVANGLARRSGDRRGGKAFCSVVPSSSMFAESGEAESESEREASERVRRGVAWGGEKRDRQITRARRTDGRTAIPLTRSLLGAARPRVAPHGCCSGGERSCGEYIKCFATKEGDSVAKMGRVIRGRGQGAVSEKEG